MPATNYYTLLGVAPNASAQDIRRAYRDLSKLYHPDTTELESAVATVKFQALNEAYATLSSPERRLTYDYKIGYSRISVIQPLGQNENRQPKATRPYDPTASAYLSPTDRPLSAGELFALFILGVTFIGCLLLVVTISLTQTPPTP
ncbi:MAG: J domain-containing protein [Cyanobacteria bacterium J06627_28]